MPSAMAREDADESGDDDDEEEELFPAGGSVAVADAARRRRGIPPAPPPVNASATARKGILKHPGPSSGVPAVAEMSLDDVGVIPPPPFTGARPSP